MPTGNLKVRFATPKSDCPISSVRIADEMAFERTEIMLKGNFANVCVSSKGETSCLVFGDEELARRQERSLEVLKQLRFETLSKDIVLTFSDFKVGLNVRPVTTSHFFARERLPRAFLRVNQVTNLDPRTSIIKAAEPIRLWGERYIVAMEFIPPVQEEVSDDVDSIISQYEIIEMPQTAV